MVIVKTGCHLLYFYIQVVKRCSYDTQGHSTGELVGGVSHIQKGIERIANIENIIRTQNLNPVDLRIAESLLNDIKDALGK